VEAAAVIIVAAEARVEAEVAVVPEVVEAAVTPAGTGAKPLIYKKDKQN
jgi:hypothetical protein